MADYQISCVNHQTEGTHSHIYSVGLVGLSGTYTVKQVYDAIDANDQFHTGSLATRNYATVAKFACSYCGRATLRSHADGQWNNNLDNLGSC